MTHAAPIRLDIRDRRAAVTLDRPAVRNALDDATTAALREGARAFQREVTPSWRAHTAAGAGTARVAA